MGTKCTVAAIPTPSSVAGPMAETTSCEVCSARCKGCGSKSTILILEINTLLLWLGIQQQVWSSRRPGPECQRCGPPPPVLITRGVHWSIVPIVNMLVQSPFSVIYSGEILAGRGGPGWRSKHVRSDEPHRYQERIRGVCPPMLCHPSILAPRRC